MQTTTTIVTEDFGEGYGKVPQETLDYFHDLEEEIYNSIYQYGKAKRSDRKND